VDAAAAMDAGGPDGHARGMTDRLSRLLRTQEQLWDRYLTSFATSGREARAALGEPPLRWSGGRLRGGVLPPS
jgi:hypothetical protein